MNLIEKGNTSNFHKIKFLLVFLERMLIFHIKFNFLYSLEIWTILPKVTHFLFLKKHNFKVATITFPKREVVLFLFLNYCELQKISKIEAV